MKLPLTSPTNNTTLALQSCALKSPRATCVHVTEMFRTRVFCHNRYQPRPYMMAGTIFSMALTRTFRGITRISAFQGLTEVVLTPYVSCGKHFGGYPTRTSFWRTTPPPIFVPEFSLDSCVHQHHTRQERWLLTQRPLRSAIQTYSELGNWCDQSSLWQFHIHVVQLLSSRRMEVEMACAHTEGDFTKDPGRTTDYAHGDSS